jgi:hypothetical protein
MLQQRGTATAECTHAESQHVAYRATELAADFLAHTLRNGHGSDAPRLRAPNDAVVRVPVLHHVLRQLRRLAGARLADDDDDLVLGDDLRGTGGTCCMTTGSADADTSASRQRTFINSSRTV